ncbi:MAG: acyltransferase [bacterium]|nr:acyltransferase [bacterium]
MNSQNTSNLSRPYFENLNGLRAIGALAVFVFHAFLLGNEIWGDFYHSTYFQAAVQVFGKGNYGVSLFFVLSGFLITYLLLHEAKSKGKIAVFGFFMRRLLRIWPVYFLVVGFGFLLYPHLPYGIQTSNSGWMYAFFLSNIEEIRNGYRDAVNFLTITWSVSIEEQFYMAWVALMAIFPFMRKAKGFLPYLLMLAVGSVVFRWMYADDFSVLYYHTFAVMSDLALGGIAAYACFHCNFQKYTSDVPKWMNVLIYFLGIGLILATRKVFVGDFIVIEKLILGFFFVYVILDQTFGKHSFFNADKIPTFFRLGTISYGFYMYHCIVIYYVQQFFKEMNWTDNPVHFVLFFMTSLLLTTVVSTLSYRLVELPILRMKKHFK